MKLVAWIGVLAGLLMGTVGGFGQVFLSGKVIDRQTGLPLPGANVAAWPEGAGTFADAEGRFDLLFEADTLRISHVGYQPFWLAAFGEGAFVVIALTPDDQLGAVEVRATRPQVNLRLPAAFATLDRRAIQLQEGLSPAPLLNAIPGIYMQTGALNTNRITIRGIGNRSPFATAKIRAYLDDIPLTNGVGETTIEDLDLSNIRKIEVWKGPTAGNYGAGLGGVLLLRTANGQEEAGAGMQLNLQAGAYGQRRLIIRSDLADPAAGLQLSLNYNRTHSDGYRENNRYDRHGFTALGKLRSGDRHRSTVLVNYNQVKAFIPSSINADDFAADPRRAAFSWRQVQGFEDYEQVLGGLSHAYDWYRGPDGKVVSSTLSLFATFRDNYESRPFNILREHNRALGFRFLTEYRKGRNRLTPNVALGAEVFNEHYDWTTNVTDLGALGPLLSDNAEERAYQNLFAEMNWDLGVRWFLTAGFNFNQTRYALDDLFPDDQTDLSGTYRFESIFSPRLSLGYRLAERLSLFANLSHGFSPPTLEETLAPDGSLNPEIRPEQGWNLEVGSRGSFLAERWSYDLALYRMWIRDLLVARRTALDQYIGINAGQTLHQGVEMQVTYRLSPSPAAPLEATLAYTYADYRFAEFIDDQADYSGNALTGAPPHQLHARLAWRHPSGWYGLGEYQFVDAFPMRDDNSIFSDAYQVVNLRTGWELTPGSRWTLDLYLGVNNLFDARYASMIQVNAAGFGGSAPRYYYPGLPRNIYGGLRLHFRVE